MQTVVEAPSNIWKLPEILALVCNGLIETTSGKDTFEKWAHWKTLTTKSRNDINSFSLLNRACRLIAKPILFHSFSFRRAFEGQTFPLTSSIKVNVETFYPEDRDIFNGSLKSITIMSGSGVRRAAGILANAPKSLKQIKVAGYGNYFPHDPVTPKNLYMLEHLYVYGFPSQYDRDTIRQFRWLRPYLVTHLTIRGPCFLNQPYYLDELLQMCHSLKYLDIHFHRSESLRLADLNLEELILCHGINGRYTLPALPPTLRTLKITACIGSRLSNDVCELGDIKNALAKAENLKTVVFAQGRVISEEDFESLKEDFEHLDIKMHDSDCFEIYDVVKHPY